MGDAAAAESAASTLYFDISAQPLANALKEFAAQSHIQLLYQYNVIENLRGNPVSGRWSAPAALQELLRNTGLEVVYSSENAATIRPAPVTAARNGDEAGRPDANSASGNGRPDPPARAGFRDWWRGCVANAVCPPAGANAAAAAAAQNVLAEVVVTGSRIITTGSDNPTPVTVVDAGDLLTTKPTTVFEGLAELPLFSGSMGAPGTPSMTGPTSGNVAALNLRNLGVLRSLVLFDGRRVPPTTADGYVSVNMLPQMLIQRVEVVTGGASAVYGSDAVTGVINFIVDRNFDGLKVNLQRGISRYNDDASYQLGIAFGTDLFAGRGRLIGSYERYYDQGIPHRVGSDRKWLEPLWTLQGNGSAANPYHLQDNVRIANATFGGLVVCPSTGFVQSSCPGAPLVGYTFDDNGVLTPFQTGSRTGLTQGTIQIGGDGAYQNWPSLKAKNRLDQLFARFDYDLSDGLHAYAAVSGALNYSASNPTNLRSFGQGFNLGACNAFLAQQYQQAYGCINPAVQSGAADQPTLRLSKVFDGFAPGNPGSQYDSYARNYFALAGFEGKLGNGYRWDAAYTHSQASMHARANRLHNLPNLYAALDAVVNPADGQIVCNVTLTHPGLYPGCVPLNPFGPTAASAAAINYAFGRIEHKAINTLDSLSGSLTGAPFSSWAGPIDMALSAELRRQVYEFTTNTLSTDIVSCTGLRFGNCVNGATSRWANAYAVRTPVEQRVAEAAIELNVPLLGNRPLFNELALNTAARFTRYDNDPGGDPQLAARSIDATTWKTGITWNLLDSLTLRWTRSRDMRAPNLFDLYEPVSANANTRTTDYLLPGAPVFSATEVLGGNPNLKPEISHTSTLGAVWRPTPDFNLAIDGYDITIKDALAAINGAAQPVQLACYASGGASPLCSLQERPLPISNTSIANAITKVYTRRINIAEQKTWGIDFEANWKTQLLGRRFSLRNLLTYQPHLIYSQPPLATNDQAGASINPAYNLLPAPVWKGTLFAHYNLTERFAVDLSQRWRSGLKWSADPAQYSIGGVPAVTYTNLNLSYDMARSSGQFKIYLNIQNLFDKEPPPSGAPNQQIQPGLTSNGFVFGDDVVGRYYTLGLRLRL